MDIHKIIQDYAANLISEAANKNYQFSGMKNIARVQLAKSTDDPDILQHMATHDTSMKVLKALAVKPGPHLRTILGRDITYSAGQHKVAVVQNHRDFDHEILDNQDTYGNYLHGPIASSTQDPDVIHKLLKFSSSGHPNYLPANPFAVARFPEEVDAAKSRYAEREAAWKAYIHRDLNGPEANKPAPSWD